MKIGLVLEGLHKDEYELAQHLLHISEHYKVDHEIFHLGHDLAAWSQQHLREIADIAKEYGQVLDPEPPSENALLAKIREKGSEIVGRESETGLLLLRDLRGVYIRACGVSSDWEMLAQAAQGIQHTKLLNVAQRCHPQTLRQMKWANGKIKESSTQVLVS